MVLWLAYHRVKNRTKTRILSPRVSLESSCAAKPTTWSMLTPNYSTKISPH